MSTILHGAFILFAMMLIPDALNKIPLSSLAGVLIYESSEVAHAQYIAATDLGKNVGALDAIMDYLVNSYYLDKKYFDFGISTEEQGKYLNINLINNKESFGARSVVYDFYEMNLQ